MEKGTPQKQKHWHVYRGRRNTGAVYRNIIDAIDAFDELLTGERTGSPAVWRECPAGGACLLVGRVRRRTLFLRTGSRGASGSPSCAWMNI